MSVPDLYPTIEHEKELLVHFKTKSLALCDEYGRNTPIAHYDLYVDKTTGHVFIYRKGGKGEPIPTGIIIK